LHPRYLQSAQHMMRLSSSTASPAVADMMFSLMCETDNYLATKAKWWRGTKRRNVLNEATICEQ
jgi:hypothetical protein